MTAWRDLLDAQGPMPPDVDPIAGDIDLLVPLQPHWRALELAGGYGSRGVGLAGRAAAVWTVVESPGEQAVVEARGAQSFVSLDVADQQGWRCMTTDQLLDLPPTLQFQLVVAQNERCQPIEPLVKRLAPGGYLVWLVSAPPLPAGGGPAGRLDQLLQLPGFVPRRMRTLQLATRRLTRAGLQITGRYLHPQGYAWGFLPVDSIAMHRYYLEVLQEQTAGGRLSRSEIARLTARMGVFSALVSTYALVAQLPEGRS